MLIHWVFTTILVLAIGLSLQPIPYSYAPAYTFIVAVYAYVIDVVFFSLVGLGLLYLRLAPGSNWRRKSKANHWVSILSALVFVAALLFPLFGMWIPDPEKKFLERTASLVPWYIPQTVGVVVLGASLIYWCGFRYLVPHVGNRGGKELIVEREPIFHVEHGYPVQVYETVRLCWKVKG